MTNKGSARLMTVGGLLLMFYAKHMDVTYSGVVNIHLMSRQNTLLMIGGFLFLGGIILLAVARMKQSPEDDAKEKADSDKAAEAVKLKTEEAVNRGSKAASSFWDGIRSHFSNPQDMRTARLTTGVLVGLTLGLLSTMFLSVGAILVFAAIVWLAYRNVPATSALRPLLGINTVIYTIIAIGMAAIGPRLAAERPGIDFSMVPLVVTLVIAVVSAFYFWRVGRSRTSNRVPQVRDKYES